MVQPCWCAPPPSPLPALACSVLSSLLLVTSKRWQVPGSHLAGRHPTKEEAAEGGSVRLEELEENYAFFKAKL